MERSPNEEEYDKIAPVIACTLPALTDSRHADTTQGFLERSVVRKKLMPAVHNCRHSAQGGIRRGFDDK